MTSFFDFQRELGDMRRPRRAADSTSQGDALTVTQLTAQIDRALKNAFAAPVLVKGEVSNYKLHNGSGHAYFTLKDAGACINCVMFKSDFARVKFDPEDGMELLVTGRVAVYAQRGTYQLYVTRMEPLGQGALELAFRQLCEKLEKEGLFAPERKKPIPLYPLRIALVTSRQTAAIQDMLKVLRRYPFLELFLYHVAVQGEGAAVQIANALRSISEGAEKIGGIDVILLARGGGSLEDLWPFNEEVVARAVAASRIPIITGIGHEIDVSVADLVADYHAHTPTEAAQVAVSRWRSAEDDIAVFASRLRSSCRGRLDSSRERLAGVMRHEFFRRPTERIEQIRQRMDDLQQQLESGVRHLISARSHRVHELALKLAEHSPRHQIAARRERLAGLQLRLQRHHPAQAIKLKELELAAIQVRLRASGRNMLRSLNERVDAIARHLNAIGPTQVLARGYSITTVKKGGAIVRSKSQIRGGMRLITRLADGEIESVAEDPNQPTLFE